LRGQTYIFDQQLFKMGSTVSPASLYICRCCI